jgi:primosomal replication protein N
MLISDLNTALYIVRKMTTKQVNDLVYWLEHEGWYRENKRRTRSWCQEVVVSNWKYDKSTVLRAMYNALDGFNWTMF